MADLTITAANVIATSIATFETGLAGEAIDAGEVVFRNASNEWVLSDADDTALDEAHAIAVNSAADGQQVTVAKPGSNVTFGSVFTAGTPYYLSATAGKIAPFADLTTGDKIICLGHAISATVLAFRPFDTGVTL